MSGSSSSSGSSPRRGERLDKDVDDVSKSLSGSTSGRRRKQKQKQKQKIPTEEESYEEEEEEAEEIHIETNESNDVMITVVDKKRAPEPDVPRLSSSLYRSCYGDDDLRMALDKYFKKKAMPPDDMREDMVIYTRKLASAAMMNEEYEKAEKYRGALLVFMDATNKNTSKAEAQRQTAELKSKLSVAEHRHKDLEYAWEDRFRNFEEQRKRSKESLVEKHQAELREFSAKWEKPETMIPFQKPSATLLQMRKMQKSYALTHDYSRARQLKGAVHSMMKDEWVGARRRAAESMRMEYEALIERQEKDLATWEDHWKRKKQTMEAEKAAEFEANGNLRKQLTVRIAAPKMPKRAQVLFPIQSKTLASTTGLYSARTRTVISDYRGQTEPMRLEIKSSDVLALMKPQIRRKLNSARRSVQTSGG